MRIWRAIRGEGFEQEEDKKLNQYFLIISHSSIGLYTQYCVPLQNNYVG